LAQGIAQEACIFPAECACHKTIAHMAVLTEAFLDELLQCSLCHDRMHEPASLSCGHSFCCRCLGQALQHRRECPMCRHPCYTVVNPRPNVVLMAILREAFPSQTSPAPAPEDAQSKARLFPVFLSTSVQLPDSTCNMHLFEPRYRLLSQMALDGGGDFVMVWARGARGFPLKVDPSILVGSTACIAHIDDSHQSPDGRFYLRCRGTIPVRVQECWVEESSGGLYMARCDALEESSLSPEDHHEPADAVEVPEDAPTSADPAVTTDRLDSQAPSASHTHVESICTTMQTLGLSPSTPSELQVDVARFSWHAAAAAAGPAGWFAPDQLQLLLETRNTSHRLAILSKFYGEAVKKRWSLRHWASVGLSHWRLFFVVALVAWGLSDVGPLKALR